MLGGKVRHTLLTNVRVGQETKPVALAHRHLKSVHFFFSFLLLFLPVYIYIVIGMCWDWSQDIPLVISRPTHLHFTHDFTPPANFKTNWWQVPVLWLCSYSGVIALWEGETERQRESERNQNALSCTTLFSVLPEPSFSPAFVEGQWVLVVWVMHTNKHHSHYQHVQHTPPRHTSSFNYAQGRSKPYYALMGRITAQLTAVSWYNDQYKR